MTENCATISRCFPNDPSSSGTVGPPQPVNEVKLLDVPAMGYSAEDLPNPRGELCVRGTNCFSVYYKGMFGSAKDARGTVENILSLSGFIDEKSTKETVDDEGWVHTGDVGEIDQCGRIKIIDRVKVRSQIRLKMPEVSKTNDICCRIS